MIRTILWILTGILSFFCIIQVSTHIPVIVPAVLVTCLASFFLLFYSSKENDPPKVKDFIIIMVLIILTGSFIRLFLAYTLKGNYDSVSWQIVADIAYRGGNVYAETHRYNYSPVWFTLLNALKHVHVYFPSLSFHFLVRGFLSCIDLIILIFLLLIARRINISLIKTAVFFYLNPVSFIISGYHGQFENIAICALLAGITCFLYLEHKPALRSGLLWLGATLGMIIKHNIFYQLLICLNFITIRMWMRAVLFGASITVFFLTFTPYWNEGSTGIINNAFRYGSLRQPYGIEPLFYFPRLKYAFILGLVIYPLLLKNKNIIKQCLMGMLFFLVFTTGISIQYFVLPIALGALMPRKGFIVYSVMTTLFVLGAEDIFNLPFFNFFKWDIVWAGAAYWFVAEHYDIHLTKIPSFPYIHS